MKTTIQPDDFVVVTETNEFATVYEESNIPDHWILNNTGTYHKSKLRFATDKEVRDYFGFESPSGFGE